MENNSISIRVEKNLKTLYFLEHPGFGSRDGLLSVLEGNIMEAFRNNERLKLKTKNSFVESHCEPSANCLLKITKSNGVTTYTITGIVVKTIRFRDLFDFNVKLRTDDPLHKLMKIMKEANVQEMFNFKYESSQNNILVPPPSMCRLPFSLDYNMFKENPLLSVKLVDGPDGSKAKMVVTKTKEKKNAFGAILLDGSAAEIPNGPGELPDLDIESNNPVQNRAYKNIKEILVRVRELFEERPIWLRHALANEIEPHLIKNGRNLFKALAFVAYEFTNGPWKACWIKYGLDPRSDSKYRHFQSIDLRGIFLKPKNIVQRSSKAPLSTTQRNQLKSNSKLIAAERKTHIIDGIHYTPSRQFQLCDIVDSNYHQLIYSIAYVASEHRVKDGWYVDGHISVIRQKLKQEMKDLRSRVYENKEGEVNSSDEQDEASGDKLQMAMLDYMEALGDEDEFDILEEDY